MQGIPLKASAEQQAVIHSRPDPQRAKSAITQLTSMELFHITVAVDLAL